MTDEALSIDELDARSVALKAAMLTWVSDMAKE
jgi:hypothetical protein